MQMGRGARKRAPPLAAVELFHTKIAVEVYKNLLLKIVYVTYRERIFLN